MLRYAPVALLCSLVVGCGGDVRHARMSAESGTAPPMSTVHAGPEPPPVHNTEEFDHIEENDFVDASREPLSTFSVDVDTASYSIVRRFLNDGRLPPPGAVRIEELVNYFRYAYPAPNGEHPFSVTADVTTCPWHPEHRLVRIGLQGREVKNYERGRANLVFLLDVSGSMAAPNKLPLVKQAMRMLLDQLDPEDRVAVVTYAGSAGVALESTPARERGRIERVFESLGAGGSTAGAGGIEAAYDVASANFVEGGVNRVVLCTDGDFNVGITDQSQLVRLIERKADSGVFLSVLGFGSGNYKDSTMEKLADHGNGNYGYVDTRNEARKMLVEQVGGTLVTIAKDVKIQVDFNPARVQSYRLLGYENRLLAAEDFLDDEKDAGEIGAGHRVTALYEIVPPGVPSPAGDVRPSKYAADNADEGPTGEDPIADGASGDDASTELLTVRLRYKQPDGNESTGFDHPVQDEVTPFADAPEDARFAAAVASFGMLLRDSKYSGTGSFDQTSRIARGSLGEDPWGYRSEFVELVERAGQLKPAR